MLLNQCPTGATVKIEAITVAPKYQLRVHELGIRPGVTAKLLRKVPPNGLVINIAGSRVAIDRNTTRNIQVEVVERK